MSAVTFGVYIHLVPNPESCAAVFFPDMADLFFFPGLISVNVRMIRQFNSPSPLTRNLFPKKGTIPPDNFFPFPYTD